LTNEEATFLFQKAGKPGELGEVAKRRLIESKLHLVLPIAEQHASTGLSMLDLIQEGNLGLMRAIDSFPETHLDNFSAPMPLLASRLPSTTVQRDRNPSSAEPSQPTANHYHCSRSCC
jgi:hypothetical protein